MKKIIFLFSIFLVVGLCIQIARAEVYDLDALTDGGGNTKVAPDTATEKPKPINTNGESAKVNQPAKEVEPSEGALSLAECLIYRKLEIEDAECDKLMSAMSCPDYATIINKCEDQHEVCLSRIGKKGSKVTYSGCVGIFKSCTDFAVDRYSACGKKFPPRQPKGEKSVRFDLTAAIGDVRVFYQDDPTPDSMEAVVGSRSIQTGAAIFTGDNGSVIFTLPNGVTQTLGPNTYFRIADYFPGEKLDRTYTILKNGNVRVGIENPENHRTGYTVITPLWKVTAKGTEFEVSVTEDGSEKISVVSGVVEVESLDGPKKFSLSPGQSFSSDASGKIADSPSGAGSPWGALPPWYANVWGWVGLAVVLGIIGVAGYFLRRK